MANAQDYPRYYVIHDTGRPVRVNSSKDIPEGMTPDGGFAPFLKVESLWEDSDRVDEKGFHDAMAKWKQK